MHPRYALVSGPYEVARCQDVEGLYGEPVPPPRLVHELRGCEPRGELARAVTQAVVEGTAPLGTLHVLTHDGLAWVLEGCRVLGARGDVVTVESAGGPRRSHTGEPAVPCGNLVRLSRVPAARTHTEITFLGCVPRGGLRQALESGAREYDPVRYQVLGHTGAVHHEAPAGRVTGWRGSAHDPGLFDLTVSFPRAGLVPHQKRQVWELWHHDRPAEPGTWRRFTGPGRAEWLRQAARRSHGVPGIVPGATHHLDGAGIVDEDSLLCALGEAVHGPGRALGAATPREAGELLAGTTLVWHHADTARACLGVQPWSAHRPLTFEEFAEELRTAGVRLVLD
ncbi:MULTISPECIES: hypothetical protein [unclassified Streptomyces]|uniref:hypothetical protein n=1 Tax=unclassified Streptomyces TaxID=2593676 RepID=UPI0016615B78|nr:MULTISPECIES: hypothetical protein [unclassified Streptomyces]MBD0707116.1 hypothetical protein [Streptomyces sp. CBMA291]MBD0713604.1 hypothetical protein [Streptomyces sp. CBMA370]